jgi:hypothetical protein
MNLFQCKSDCSDRGVKGAYQGCLRTDTNPTAWIRIQMAIWPSSGVKTFRETRFAVGRFRLKTGNGPVHPTAIY